MAESNKYVAAKANEISNVVRENTTEATEVGQHVAQVGTDIARSVTEISQQAVQSTLHIAVQVAERSVDQFERTFGLSGQEAQEAAEQSSENIQAITECTTILAQGAQDISREWLDWVQKRVQRHLEGFDAVLRSRTPQDLIAAQSDLVRGNLELLLDTSRRVDERSRQLAAEAGMKITAQAESTAARARRAAAQARHAA